MADPTDMIVPLLREMRAENAELHPQTRSFIEQPNERLAACEDGLPCQAGDVEQHS